MVSLHPPPPIAEAEASEKLTVILVYEDETVLQYAQRSLDRVIGQIGDGAIIQQRTWSFEMLEIAEVVAEAGLWLRATDVIVVAARREQPAPAALTTWLKYWLEPEVEHPTAFVVLGMISPDALVLPHALFSSLEPLSLELGMRFFSTSVAQPGDTN